MDQGSAFALGALIVASWVGLLTSFTRLNREVQQSLTAREQQLRLQYTLLVEIREQLRATTGGAAATVVLPRTGETRMGEAAPRGKLLAEEAA